MTVYILFAHFHLVQSGLEHVHTHEEKDHTSNHTKTVHGNSEELKEQLTGKGKQNQGQKGDK